MRIKTANTEKVIEIVAGPNGSGKTTFAEAYFLKTKKSLVFLKFRSKAKTHTQ